MYSPNGQDRNQTAHVLKSMVGEDMKVGRGANVGSNHQLVEPRIKMKNKGTRHKTMT